MKITLFFTGFTKQYVDYTPIHGSSLPETNWMFYEMILGHLFI